MESPILHQSPTRQRDRAVQCLLPGFDDHQPRPPRRRLSRVTRATGYQTAQRQLGQHATRLIAYLRAHGPATDHDCSAGLALPLASINSLRNGLIKRGVVVAVDIVPGPYRARRTRWGLR